MEVGTFCIEKDYVVICCEMPDIPLHLIVIMQNDFVLEIVLPEDLVHQDFDVMPDVPVEMDIDARVVRHDGLDGEEVGVHPVEVFFLFPDVAVHFLLEGGEGVVVEGAFGFGGFGGLAGVAAEIDGLGVVGAGGEGRVDVDEVDGPPGIAQRGAGGKAFAADDEVAVTQSRQAAKGILRVFASLREVPDVFERFHLVKGHAAADKALGVVAAGIAEGALEVVQQRLAADGFGKEGDVADGHGEILSKGGGSWSIS